MEREPDTLYVLSLSYGKDSIASIEACKQLGYPLDAIIHGEVWFNDEISADLPPMLEFKKYADEVIKERYGLDVVHVCATWDGKKKHTAVSFTEPSSRQKRHAEYNMPEKKDVHTFTDFHTDAELGATASSKSMRLEKLTYCDIFYRRYANSKTKQGEIYGFPTRQKPTCQNELKAVALDKFRREQIYGYPTLKNRWCQEMKGQNTGLAKLF